MNNYASVLNRLSGLGSDMWSVHIKGRELASRGEDVIELTIGEPDISPDKTMLDQCTKAIYAGRTRYSNGRGEPDLVKALVDKYQLRSQNKLTAENILCFPGAQSALFAVMTGLVEVGDQVLVCDPYYATYAGIIKSTGADIISVPLRANHQFRLQPKDLEAAITPECRVLLLNYPHNPTGAVLSNSELLEIGKICRKHNLWIVSDEVYEELIFNEQHHSPFDLPDLIDRTVVVSSISKSHAVPGFRSGWAVGPAGFFNMLLPLSESMLFGGQPFIADMTAYALTHKQDTSNRMKKAYKRRAKLVCEALSADKVIFPHMPEAGMFVFVDIRNTGMNGNNFSLQLLEREKVSTMPGSSFGDQATGFIRLSLSVPDDLLAEACKRIRAFVQHLD